MKYEIICSQIALSIRKLASAASSHEGSDCYTFANLAGHLLKHEGIESVLVVGHAAWRVSSGDSDVILHAPLSDIPYPMGAMPYHAWLEIPSAGLIFDSTLYQLRKKASELDKQDGGHTTVDWCPDYLLAPKSSVSTLKDVIQLTAGLFFYERNERLEKYILDSAPVTDEGDIAAAMIIYRNTDLVVHGPNNYPKGVLHA